MMGSLLVLGDGDGEVGVKWVVYQVYVVWGCCVGGFHRVILQVRELGEEVIETAGRGWAQLKYASCQRSFIPPCCASPRL